MDLHCYCKIMWQILNASCKYIEIIYYIFGEVSVKMSYLFHYSTAGRRISLFFPLTLRVWIINPEIWLLCCFQLTYVMFLLCHSYMVLVDFRKDEVTPLEWFMVLWVLSFFIDEIYTVCIALFGLQY